MDATALPAPLPARWPRGAAATAAVDWAARYTPARAVPQSVDLVAATGLEAAAALTRLRCNRNRDDDF
jgi:hypothetical protein